MTVYDIAYSLNASTKITADSYVEAEQKLQDQLKEKGVDLEEDYTLEVFDVTEEEE